VKHFTFSSRDVEKLLKDKSFLDEIIEIVESIQRVDHREIQNGFSNKGWEAEKPIFPSVS
jgi:hypothetical protein